MTRLGLVLLGALAAAGACADTPAAIEPRAVGPTQRASANLDPDGGCGPAAQQFYNLYGYEPTGIICHINGSGWLINISFYWDEYDLRSGWYVWLANNGYTIGETCGDPVLDEIMASYYDAYYYTGSEVPTCHEFSQTTRTQYFSHEELSQGNGTAGRGCGLLSSSPPALGTARTNGGRSTAGRVPLRVGIEHRCTTMPSAALRTVATCTVTLSISRTVPACRPNGITWLLRPSKLTPTTSNH